MTVSNIVQQLYNQTQSQKNTLAAQSKHHDISKAFKLEEMSSTSTTQIVRPARTVQGSLTLPGDKSISHRYAMLAGIAEGTTHLSNFSTGADPHSSLACMQALGATVVHAPNETIAVTGTAGCFIQPATSLDCGNSGSTMRMLAGLIAPHSHTFTLIGDHSLTLRPMERIRKPLIQMGAKIDLVDGHAPITIHGCSLNAIDFDTPIPSAQVKTAVLFAGLQANGTTSLTESIRTRDHSEHALRAFGATLHRNEDKLSIPGGQKLKAIDATIPGDLSSAAFFLCAALLFPDSNLILDSIGMNPTRASLLDVIISLGGKIKVLNVEEHHGELIGTIQVNGPANGPRGMHIGGALSAQIIDELPVLAAIAPYTNDGITIRGARELRVKESDRIALVARNLKAMGATFTEHEDGLEIPGNQHLHGAQIDSGSDHRIAMAFAIAALRATSDTEIHGAEAAAISFPEFFTHLDELCQR
jgi:3-phosphoshikimate 1-carboxyvinyltransferase